MPLGSHRLIFEKDYASTATQDGFNLEPGQYEQLIFRFSGTSIAGAFDPATSGDLEISFPFGSSRKRFSFVDDLAQMKGGSVSRIAASPGAFDWTVPYRVGALFGDPSNVLIVDRNERVRVSWFWDQGALATLMVGNNITVRVYAVEKTGLMAYRLRVNRLDLEIASGSRRHVLPYENIVGVYLENDTSLDRIGYQQDNDFFEIERLPLLQSTHWDNVAMQSYSATFPLLEINFARRARLGKIKNNSNILTLHGSGAGTVEAHVYWLDYTPNELRASVAIDAQDSEARISQKVSKEMTRPLEVDNILSGISV